MKTTFTVKQLPVLFVFMVIILAGCKKEPLVAPGSTTGNTSSVNSTYYLTGRLDNEIINITGIPSSYAAQVSVDSDGACHEFNDHDGDDNFQTGYITGMQWLSNGPDGTPAPSGSFELRKLSVRVYVAPVANDLPSFFYNLVAPSNYSFANSSDPNNGAYITLRDKSNVLWTSMGDQSGSTFQIISRGSNRGTSTAISGIISCKMYDGKGNVKAFTAGAFNAMTGL